MRKKLIASLAIITTLLMMVSGAKAADLTVAPANNYVAVDGGQELLVDYTLENRENVDVTVILESMSFTPSEGGEPQLKAPEFPYIQLVENGEEVEEIVIPAGASKEIQVKLSPPLGLAVKEYPLTLLFTALTEEQVMGSGAEIGLQVGSNLIVRLDTSNEDLSDLSLEILEAPQFLDTFETGVVTGKTVNFGAFATLVNGEATLKKGEKVIMSWQVNPDVVLGQSARKLRFIDGQDTSQKKVLDELTLSRLMLGKYTLEVTVYSGLAEEESSSISTVVADVWALPYWLILLVVVIIALVIIVMQVNRRNNKKKQLQKRVARMKAQKKYFE